MVAARIIGKVKGGFDSETARFETLCRLSYLVSPFVLHIDPLSSFSAYNAYSCAVRWWSWPERPDRPRRRFFPGRLAVPGDGDACSNQASRPFEKHESDRCAVMILRADRSGEYVCNAADGRGA